eukprot:TRINITY_DN19394_c0_g1_i1.p1 TRINITY_DN19394_c0_g1~~TRINITY_DN19394_c0_g1_i1.p1  ORF type:complete len:261 (-),score=34.95 TRINITY_DN19394_c0_g1_i1:156-938(-)
MAMKQLVSAGVLAATWSCCRSDILPPPTQCDQVCSAPCKGGTQECCLGGRPACTKERCGAGFVQLPNFRCADGLAASMQGAGSTHCCVPTCTSNNDCVEGEICGEDKGFGRTCRTPHCMDFGGICRNPQAEDSHDWFACMPGELEKSFFPQCNSGCGFWRGPCGQTCCIPDSSQQASAIMSPEALSGAPKQAGSAAEETTIDQEDVMFTHIGEVVLMGGIASLCLLLYKGVTTRRRLASVMNDDDEELQEAGEQDLPVAE